MLNLKKSDPHKTHSLANDFALICAISDNGLFEKHFKEFFPEKLELKKDNVFSSKTSSFDIDLEIKDKKP